MIKKLALLIAIIFNLFIALFAFDVFSEGYALPELLIGLLMHLLPNIILGLVTYLAYKKSLYGAVIFLLLGIIFTIFFSTYNELITFIIISGPLFVISFLLFLSLNLINKS